MQKGACASPLEGPEETKGGRGGGGGGQEVLPGAEGSLGTAPAGHGSCMAGGGPRTGIRSVVNEHT